MGMKGWIVGATTVVAVANGLWQSVNAQSSQASNAFVGTWSGWQQNSGGGRNVELELQFSPDGTYKYVAAQVAELHPKWKMTQIGTYTITALDRQALSAKTRALSADNHVSVVELKPDSSRSTPLPSESERTAMTKILKLPNDQPQPFYLYLVSRDKAYLVPLDQKPGSGEFHVALARR